MLPLARAAGRISGPRARTSFPQSLVGRPTPVTPAFKTSKHFAPSLPFRTSSTKSATHSFRSRRRALYALALAAGVGCGAYILIEVSLSACLFVLAPNLNVFFVCSLSDTLPSPSSDAPLLLLPSVQTSLITRLDLRLEREIAIHSELIAPPFRADSFLSLLARRRRA